MKRFAFIGLLSLLGLSSLLPSIASAETLYPYTTSFVVSAYYSPCVDQDRYATGTYEGDIRLNGSGVNSANGTPVYPGMIAAPKSYPFGTVLSLPGIGVVRVEDRGGAIVEAGVRGHEYDRLDVWMGHCDEGLSRALQWGVRTVNGATVYGVDASIQTNVYLEGFQAAEAVVKNVILAPELFDQDLWYLNSGDDVRELQQYLTQLGYYQGAISGHYGDDTREAVFEFQRDQSIVDSVNDWGAGYFGVNTRKALDLAVSRLRDEQQEKSESEASNDRPPNDILARHPDLPQGFNGFGSLSRGSSGEPVIELQRLLTQLGYLRIDSNDFGYYGELTEHAVFKLQQKWGLVNEKSDSGAGSLGPQTVSRLNALVDTQYSQVKQIAMNREAFEIDSNNGSVLALGDRGDSVRELQETLRLLGYFKGTFLTDFFGEQTHAALIAFQQAYDLIESPNDPDAGRLTRETAQLLDQVL